MLNKRKFYINGQWVDPIKKNDLEVINPCNEDPFAVISLGSKEDTDLAVKSAKIAFETWKETGKEEKINLLNELLSVYNVLPDPLNVVADFSVDAGHRAGTAEPERCQTAQKSLQYN